MFSHIRYFCSLRLNVYWILFALGVQTVSMLSPYGVDLRADEITHCMVHNQQADHHHHDDLSVHIEETVAAETHHHAPSGLQSFGLVTLGLMQLGVTTSSAPGLGNLPLYAQPWIDGWLRPPKHVA